MDDDRLEWPGEAAPRSGVTVLSCEGRVGVERYRDCARGDCWVLREAAEVAVETMSGIEELYERVWRRQPPTEPRGNTTPFPLTRGDDLERGTNFSPFCVGWRAGLGDWMQ